MKLVGSLLPGSAERRTLKRILVTGASGFIGRHAVCRLRRDGVVVRGVVRDHATTPAGIERVEADIRDAHAMRFAARGCDAVLHLAAQTREVKTAPETDYTSINVEGTANLLMAASAEGIERFVFFSSVKAMGENTRGCLDESAEPAPTTAYGRSKLAAEDLVSEYGKRHHLHVVCLRLPVVYGPNNKGNLYRMITAIDHGLFPPLPETGNRRSMVHVSNVVEAAWLALTRADANGQRYIVTDARPYSTRELYEALCGALGRPVPGWSVPVGLLAMLARIGDVVGLVRGKRFVFDSDALDKLLGSAWYSSARITRELAYRPVTGLTEALPELITWYRSATRTNG